jgi:hypothetical protein
MEQPSFTVEIEDAGDVSNIELADYVTLNGIGPTDSSYTKAFI